MSGLGTRAHAPRRMRAAILGAALVGAAGCQPALQPAFPPVATPVATPVAAPTRVAPTMSAGEGRVWVDSVMRSLTTRQKVAQLVWPWVLGDYQADNAPQFQRQLRLIRDEQVGGVIISIGSPVEVAAKLNALQRAAKLPLLVGADLETGAAFRFRGGYATPNGLDLGGSTMFPPPMAIGATNDPTLAAAMGTITAKEGRAIGAHIAFAPVLDVNNNPRNPVIGARAFSERADAVGRLGAAFIRGMQSAGMAATGKHFPGHGDTEQNSHLELARVTASRARIDSVELAPYREAIAAGMRGVMGFHGRMDALDSTGVAATLSKRIMTNLLRDELGFRGLVVTDALDMNGVMGSLGQSEVCVRAFDAGADILLMPSDLPQCITSVTTAVDSGRVSMSRLDASVRRLLEEKVRMGLPLQRTVDVEAVRAVVGDTAHLAVARTVAERAITLAKDSLNQVPLARLPRETRVLSVTVATRTDLGAGATFNAELQRRFPRVKTELVMPEQANDATVATQNGGPPRYVAGAGADAAIVGGSVGNVLRAADSADVVIVSSYVNISSVTATAAAPRGVVELLRALRAKGKQPIVVAFGSPYLLTDVPEVSAYLVAWSAWPLAQRAAARAVLGEIPIRGVLPASVGPGAPSGAGLQRPLGVVP
ncbi:MAG: glycoside hydrolase family 3 N-terminal domain-containing protein [Gemmatimonadaceae bacterium]|nr:glycoside hydrolase family 3 N-terminal domain-containing protein [Gemmatimonadaceae bacterium]